MFINKNKFIYICYCAAPIEFGYELPPVPDEFLSKQLFQGLKVKATQAVTFKHHAQQLAKFVGPLLIISFPE
jgi:hypothetical protein